MAAIGRGPLVPFLASGFGGIFLFFIGQLTSPFLSNFNKVEGVLVKYETVKNHERGNKMIRIWLNDTISQPYVNYYNAPQRELKKHIDSMEHIILWVNKNREIMQLEANGIKIVDYHWFNPWLLILLGIGLFFHIYSYKETKSKTTNINTYWDMWEYALGGRYPIMKYNNKPYDPKNVFPF
jgi:hypothetical protein